MTTLFESAFAKLNLTLDVLGKRADGYHDLRSVMQTISIQDDIAIDVDTGKPWSLECSADGIPRDSRNLAWRAAEVYCSAVQKNPDGLAIRICKRIPSGAGMGGGSADAAAVLRALNRYYGEPLSLFALADLGAQVGSDVPFCVLGGTAMAEGRGERLRRLPNLPECTIAVCKPDFPVSTPQLYHQLDMEVIENRPNHEAMERALLSGDLVEISRQLENVFDPVVSREHPELRDIKLCFRRFGALGTRMTGSGSAVFAIMPELASAEAACDMLKKTYGQVFIANPV